MKCGFYTHDGEICQVEIERIKDMMPHILAEHGQQELNEFLDREIDKLIADVKL